MTTTVVPPRKLLPSVKRVPEKAQTIAGLYDLAETLGKGHYATVKAARHVFTGESVAVKIIDKSKLDEISRKSLLKEVLCMKLVQHPNVVKLYEVIDTREKLYLVLELGRGGDLYDLIQERGLDEELARNYFGQILAAVSYCHKLHVVHRDLKPENVVFFPSENGSPGLVKLTDFGFSNKFCPGEKLDTSCGSLAYSAPEILLGDAYDAPKVDIWSLGVLLYMLVTGRAPFQEANDSETLTMIMDVKYRMPDNVTLNCRDLISRMLQRHPPNRASLEEIEGHVWVGQRPPEGPLIQDFSLTNEQKERVIQKMVGGNVVQSRELVLEALGKDAYNYITSTYYLLAEKMLRERDEDPDEEINTTASLESLSNVGQGRRASVHAAGPPPAASPPAVESLPVSASHSSGLSLHLRPLSRRKSTIKESEEEEPISQEEKKSLFSWLFNRKKSRIYKTRSCSELKVFKVNK